MFYTLYQSMRPPFLILTFASVFLGFATAMDAAGSVVYRDIFLVLLGAITAHISVNMFNEYYDFRSGLDAITTKTPFSGGSGALVAAPDESEAVWYVAVATLLITILVGFYFVVTVGLLLAPIGVLGLAIIISYTQWINRHPILCLFAPGIAFGPLMVIGSHYVLAGYCTVLSIYVSLVPLFLASNLLLLNQLPDIAADKTVGRKHFPISYGIKKSLRVYAVFSIAVVVVIIAAVISGLLPPIGYIALLPMMASVISFYGVSRFSAIVEKMVPYLAINVMLVIATPVLVGIAILVA